MADAVVTIIGRQKMAKARVGEATLPTIVGVAFGTGGVAEDGTVLAPSTDQTKLNKEVLRKVYDSYQFMDNGTTVRYTCRLLSDECAGESLSEVALYDTDGDLIGIKNFLPKGKDEDIEMTFDIDDKF